MSNIIPFIKHGEVPKSGINKHSRWCYFHGWHGILYMCDYYPTKVRKKIMKLTQKWISENRPFTTVNYEIIK